MSSKGLAVLVDHLVGVAVVCGDKRHAVHLADSGNNLTNAVVNSLNSLNSRLKNACVTNHVAVGEVEDDHIVNSAVNSVNQLILDLISAHLGL